MVTLKLVAGIEVRTETLSSKRNEAPSTQRIKCSASSDGNIGGETAKSLLGARLVSVLPINRWANEK